MCHEMSSYFFFFFNDTATTEIYTLSLHDALPIWPALRRRHVRRVFPGARATAARLPSGRRLGVSRPADRGDQDRKSTRLNSSHSQISYAVFCLKKKKKKQYYFLLADLDFFASTAL